MMALSVPLFCACAYRSARPGGFNRGDLGNGSCPRWWRLGEPGFQEFAQLTTIAIWNSGQSSTPAICRDLLRELCWRAAQQRLEIVDQMRLIEISQIKGELRPVQLFAGI